MSTTTFRKHFDDDITRVGSILDLANGGSPVVKKKSRANDLRHSCIAMAVGAMDAYFCDAYVDCLALRLRAHKNGRFPLPRSYSKRNLPTEVLLAPSQELRPNWALRMAARDVMEKENVLNLQEVSTLFNPVLPNKKRLWPNVMEPLINLDWKRLTGIRKADYRALPAGKPRGDARKAATRAVKIRIGETIQLRHDWIHNCGRPKVAVKALTPGQTRARVREVRAVVEIVDDHLMAYRIV